LSSQIREFRGLLGVRERQTVQGDPRLSRGSIILLGSLGVSAVRFSSCLSFVSFVSFVVQLLIFSVCFRVIPWLIGFHRRSSASIGG